MTPNPDSIQETTIQTNTYNVDYGRSSSIQMTMTTKSGGNKYHGNLSDYFQYQGFFAHTDQAKVYEPFHSNNISATIGGPIIPHHDGFFFFAIEPLRSSTAVSYSSIFEDRAFTTFAKTNFPNSVGTLLLSTYPGHGCQRRSGKSDRGRCVSGNQRYSLRNRRKRVPALRYPVFDSGNYSSSAFRNGNQYSLRLDKNFKAERLYGAYYRTTLTNNSTSPRAAFDTVSNFAQYAIQVNETHTFNATTLNEASFAAMRVEGVEPATGLFTVPVVNVTWSRTGLRRGLRPGRLYST